MVENMIERPTTYRQTQMRPLHLLLLLTGLGLVCGQVLAKRTMIGECEREREEGCRTCSDCSKCHWCHDGHWCSICLPKHPPK